MDDSKATDVTPAESSNKDTESNEGSTTATTAEGKPSKTEKEKPAKRRGSVDEDDFDELGLDYMEYLEEEKPEEVEQPEEQTFSRDYGDYTGTDYRIPWLKKVVCLYLNEPDQDVFDEMLVNQNIKSAILKYFNNDLSVFSLEEAPKHRAVFFWKMFIEDEFFEGDAETEIEEDEETELETEDTTASTSKGSKKKTKGKGKKKGKKKKKKKKGKKKKKKKKNKKKKKKKRKGKKGKKKGKRRKKRSKETSEETTTETTKSYPSDKDTDLDVESLPEDTKKKSFFEFATTMLPKYFGKLKNVLAMYMIRASRIPIPVMRSMEEAESEMPKHLMFGNLHGYDLKSMQAVLKKVFRSLLLDSDLNAPTQRFSLMKQENSSLTAAQKQQLKDELMTQLDMLLDTLDRAIAQKDGQLKLSIPEISELEHIHEQTLELMKNNKTFIAKLEDLVRTWEQEIVKILEQDLPKKPSSFTPLAELEFWRDRAAQLSAINDQLQSSTVQKVIMVLNSVKSYVLPGFYLRMQDLLQNLQSAKDITRSIGTIERHLKTITYSNNFNEMADTLPHILKGLQLIWMLSRHYNKEDKMCGMLEMIANLLYERATAILHPKSLFKREPMEAIEIADAVRTLLLTWKECYMNTRDKIEKSGKGARWECDRSRLFPRTDYAAIIAQHLSEIAVVLLEFQNFFGPEIKTVIGDPKKIEDALKKSYLLVKPFMEVTFDPFLPVNNKLWSELLEQLRKDVQLLEAEAKSFMDEAFANIKSAESAFEMLMKFKFIETRDGIQELLMKKFDDTLMVYIQEVHRVKTYFEDNRDEPPLLKYHPPVAGRIWWMKLLFYRIKKSILTFRTQQDVIGTEAGQLACQEYLTVAKDMKSYEDNLHQKWVENARQTMSTSLRKNILSVVPATTKDLGRNFDVCKNKNVYEVNLPSDLIEMIQEALHLEQMGYRIAESVSNVSLQRNQYIKHSRSLNTIVENYYKIRMKLRPAETQLLEKTLKEMDKYFDQGALRWNWTALGIPEYANTLSYHVKDFEELVNKVNVIARDVRFNVVQFKDVMLFKEPPYKAQLSFKLPIMNCWDYFLYWDKYRAKKWDKLLSHYRGLPPLFMKLENLIYNSSTGKLKQFRRYYMKWEKLICHYMGKFVIKSLHIFETRLLQNDPLFEVEALLQVREIRLSPSPHEIYTLIIKGARDCLEGTQKFLRWMRASCIEVPAVSQGRSEPPFVYSFYLDVGRIPRMVELFMRIQENTQTLLTNIWNHLKKFRIFKNLIRFNKDRTVEQFARTSPPVDLFDEKMAFYTQIERRMAEMPAYKVEGCIRVDFRPLLSSISKHAREWVLKLGEFLLISARDLSGEFDQIVSDYERDLHLVPRNMEGLNNITQTIQAILSATINMEGIYRDLSRRYSVLKFYNIEYPQDDTQMLEDTWKRWQMLWLYEVKVVNKKIQPIKAKFAKLAASADARAKLREELSKAQFETTAQ